MRIVENIMRLDEFDRKLLRALQGDGRLSNTELGDMVGLSPSQCSRRRTALEKSGVIRGYVALVEPEEVGVGLISIISVTLATHNEDNAQRLRDLLTDLPNVQEAHSLTGEMDYSIKVVSSDLKALSQFINEVLLPHEAVQNVKTSIVLDTLKSTPALPIGGSG